MSRKVVLRICLVSSAVNSLGKKMWGQVVAPGVTGQQQEGFTPCTALGTEEAGGCFFPLAPVFVYYWGLQSSGQPAR